MQTNKLHLWVANQPPGSIFDATDDYVAAAMDVSEGSAILSSLDGAELWRTFVELRDQVAITGHGDGCEDLEPPELLASLTDPEEDPELAESERLASRDARGWDDYIKRCAKLRGEPIGE